MLPFFDNARAAAASGARTRPRGRARTRRDHLRDDRRAAPASRGSRRSAVDAAAGAGRRRRRPRDDRPAGARRGDDDLPRRPRDDGQRARVDVVSPRASTGGRGAAARGDRSRARRPAADDRGRAERCRSSSRWSPRRCGCIRRRGSSAAARSVPYQIDGYLAAGALDRRRSARTSSSATRAGIPEPRAVRARALDAGVQGGAAAVRVLAVRRRHAPLHR